MTNLRQQSPTPKQQLFLKVCPIFLRFPKAVETSLRKIQAVEVRMRCTFVQPMEPLEVVREGHALIWPLTPPKIAGEWGVDCAIFQGCRGYGRAFPKAASRMKVLCDPEQLLGRLHRPEHHLKISNTWKILGSVRPWA